MKTFKKKLKLFGLNQKAGTPFLYRIFPYFLSFSLPSFILRLTLSLQGIYWGSSITILASDGFHQYVIFAQTLRNLLHGKESLFYSFTSGLGLNFYALMSYYLGSFLSPFYYFFDLRSMPDAIYLFTLIKFGGMGLTSYFMLTRVYKSVNKMLVLVLSNAYALMSFATSQIEITMWQDVFMLAPIIILGLHYLFEENRIVIYYLSLTILFVLNYYFGYMLAIYTVIYSLVNFLRKSYWARWMSFILVSVLAALSASFILLPTTLDLQGHGEGLTSVSSILATGRHLLDGLAKSMVGVYDTTQFNAHPMVYVGLLPLTLTLLYFSNTNIPRKERLRQIILPIVFLASFMLEPLDLLWQGLHAPNMFLYRYAWLLSLTLIILAGKSLSNLQNVTISCYVRLTIVLIVSFLGVFIWQSRYDYLEWHHLVYSIVFLLVYSMLVLGYQYKIASTNTLILLTVIFTSTELALNTYYQLTGIQSEWHFPSRQVYEENIASISRLVQDSQLKKDNFYRLEILSPQTGNDSMKYGYHGISQFSSVRNRKSSRLLDQLGFKSEGTNLNLRYQNNTLIADSLFGVAYNISLTNPNKYGFTWQSTQDTLELHSNQYASQLGILTDEVYKDIAMVDNYLDNQATLLNHLSGLQLTYFQNLPMQIESRISDISEGFHLDKSLNQVIEFTFSVKVPANSQLYLNLENLFLEGKRDLFVETKAGTQLGRYYLDNSNPLFNLGTFKKVQDLKVTLTFPEADQVRFDQLDLYALDLVKYDQAMTTINSRQVMVEQAGNQVYATYASETRGSLVFTLPYDKGWSAELNGESLAIRPAQEGLMVVDIPKGQGQVMLTFVPYGLKIGLILSCLGILGFLGYVLYLDKKSRSSYNRITSEK